MIFLTAEIKALNSIGYQLFAPPAVTSKELSQAVSAVGLVLVMGRSRMTSHVYPTLGADQAIFVVLLVLAIYAVKSDWLLAGVAP